MHACADLFTAIEWYSLKAASTVIFIHWIYWLVKREFRR